MGTSVPPTSCTFISSRVVMLRMTGQLVARDCLCVCEMRWVEFVITWEVKAVLLWVLNLQIKLSKMDQLSLIVIQQWQVPLFLCLHPPRRLQCYDCQPCKNKETKNKIYHMESKNLYHIRKYWYQRSLLIPHQKQWQHRVGWRSIHQLFQKYLE